MQDRTLIKDLHDHVGQEVTLAGFIDIRRDHGKLIFIDLRDFTGKVQMVFLPSNPLAHEKAKEVRPEWVITVRGIVNKRPEKMVNSDEATGDIEIEVTDLTVLSKAETPPFDIASDGHEINEEIRNKYRYLDLRRERLQKNLRLRHQVTTLVREYLTKENFVEIETPLLTKTSPEGARDFIVPSRFYPGKFYALPQAPQQYKQLLMIAGFERYFQLARALRDEDLRGDRQFEHTQIDMEVSFVTEEELRAIVEGMFIYVAESLGKKITKKPFPVYTHEAAMKEFGADKFDIRENKDDTNELAFAWVVDFPLLEKDESTGKITFAHNPFSAPKAEHAEKLMNGEDLLGLRAQQYDLVLNGVEIASGGVRISDPKVQRKVFEIMGLTPLQIEERFGHILKAYEFGAPPHAGAAPGLDRFIMILAGESSIREVIAFPASATGQTAVMDAPSEVPDETLRGLGISIIKNKK